MEIEPKNLKSADSFYIKRYWPNLSPSSFHFTSDENPIYNCVAWVDEIQNDSIDFSQDDEGNPLEDEYYHTSLPYIKYFEGNGFERCEDGKLENNYEKIAIYEKNSLFKHVAKQLSNGNWTSKMGEWEDIEHYTLEAVERYPYKNQSFGKVSVFMKRKLNS